jgi:hypothetical protein
VGLAQRLGGILVEPQPVEPDHAHGVARVAIDEGQGALDGARQGLADVLLVARIPCRSTSLVVPARIAFRP